MWIFTDGSAIWHQDEWRLVGGYGVIVVGWCKDLGAYGILDCLFGPVITDVQHPMWKGATAETSGAAELEAVCWAAQWALHAPINRSKTKIHWISDFAAGLFGTSGDWNWARVQVQHQWARHLWKAVETACVVQYLWAKGHSGLVWNELADRLAWFAVHTKASNVGCVGPQLAVFCEALPWLWMMPVFNPHNVDLPRIAGDQIIFEPILQPEVGDEIDKAGADLRNATELTCELNLTVATINVQTFHEDRHLHDAVGRARALQAQCESRQWAVVGLQETRRSFEGAYTAGCYYICCAAGSKGCAGVELWFHRTIPWGTRQGELVYFQPSAATIVVANSRLLVVRCVERDIRLVFVVAYAPHECRPACEKEQFWADVSRVLQPLSCAGFSIIFCSDANARLGSVGSAAVGDYAADEQNGNGQFLHSFATKHGLVIPSTFGDFQVCPGAPSGTWFCFGEWRRIDYLAVSSHMVNAATYAFVDVDFDMLQTHHDHRPSVLHLHFTLRLSGRGARKQPSLYRWIDSACDSPIFQVCWPILLTK